jgi:hypothetical protein
MSVRLPLPLVGRGSPAKRAGGGVVPYAQYLGATPLPAGRKRPATFSPQGGEGGRLRRALHAPLSRPSADAEGHPPPQGGREGAR